MEAVESPIGSEGMGPDCDMGIMHLSQNDLHPGAFAFQIEVPAQDHGKVLLVELRYFFKDEFGTLPPGLGPNMVKMGVEHHEPATVLPVLKYAIGTYPGKGGVPSLGRDFGGRGQPKGGFLQELKLGGIVENGGEFPSIVPMIAAHSKISVIFQAPVDILQLVY